MTESVKREDEIFVRLQKTANIVEREKAQRGWADRDSLLNKVKEQGNGEWRETGGRRWK